MHTPLCPPGVQVPSLRGGGRPDRGAGQPSLGFLSLAGRVPSETSFSAEARAGCTRTQSHVLDSSLLGVSPFGLSPAGIIIFMPG